LTLLINRSWGRVGAHNPGSRTEFTADGRVPVLTGRVQGHLSTLPVMNMDCLDGLHNRRLP